MVVGPSTFQGNRRLVRLLPILLLLAAAPALAESSDSKQCLRPSGIERDAKQRIEVCTRAIELAELSQENLARAHNNRGLAYVAEGDVERAIADFDKSLELHPGYVNALMDRGMAHGMKGDHDRAVADFGAAIRQNPDSADAYNGRCYSLALKGDAAAAIEDCNRALACNRTRRTSWTAAPMPSCVPPTSAAPSPTTT